MAIGQTDVLISIHVVVLFVVFVGDSIVRKTDGVLLGAKIEAIAERVETSWVRAKVDLF